MGTIAEEKWLEFCRECNKTCSLCDGTDIEELPEYYSNDDPALGEYTMQCRAFRCRICGYEWPDWSFPNYRNILETANQARIEFLLRKNYPMGKTKYFTMEELVRKFPKKFHMRDVREGKKPSYSSGSRMYFIVENGIHFYPVQAVRMLLRKRPPKGMKVFGNRYNLMMPEDCTWEDHEKNSEKLGKLINPDYCPEYYYTEAEALELERRLPFHLGREHFDFFTHNLEWCGQRLYLEASCEYYALRYNGLVDIEYYAEEVTDRIPS